MSVKVTKMDGTKEDYSEEKIKASANRVGVPSELAEAMIKEIRNKLYDGIHTSEIFQIIKDYLSHSNSPQYSIKYNLKESLAELGPSGYPFEQYVAALLQEVGYKTTTNQIITGKCVSHEVDVVAVKDDIKYFVEAKFHSSPNQRTDVKVPLYIRARYEDLRESNGANTQAWIVTNTKFTSEAITYGQCVGIKLTSWGYPHKEGIMDLIERTHLHPITILEGLTKEDKTLLLSENIVLCRQLVENQSASELIPKSRRDTILKQARLVCGK